MGKPTLILVDFSHLMYRSWHTFKNFKTSTGILSGIHFGVWRAFEHFKNRFPDCVVIFCMDGRPVKKLQRFPTYKSNRGSDTGHEIWDVFRKQAPFLRTMLTAAGAAIAYAPDLEADDVIAMLSIEADRGSTKGVWNQVYIYSGDNDFIQLATNRVFMWKPKAGPHNPERYQTPDDIEDEWGVKPDQIPLLRAFIGDKSDNITGIPRLPRARIKMALSELDVTSPEGFYSSQGPAYFPESWQERLTDFRDRAVDNWVLIKLPWGSLEEVDIDYLSGPVNLESLDTIFRTLEFSRTLKKLGEVVELFGEVTYAKVLGQSVGLRP